MQHVVALLSGHDCLQRQRDRETERNGERQRERSRQKKTEKERICDNYVHVRIITSQWT